MELDEEDREYRRRRRRSVRNLRRQSGVLAPLNLVLEEEAEEKSEVPQPDQASLKTNTYGSLWMDSNEPIKKRKKRRSSMFFGIGGLQLSPLRGDDDNTVSSEAMSEVKTVNCATGQMMDNLVKNQGSDPYIPEQETYQSKVLTSPLVNRETVRITDNNVSKMDMPVEYSDKNALNGLNESLNDSQLKTPKVTTSSTINDDNSFTSEACAVRLSNQSEVSVSQVSPCSMSPEYPPSMCDMYDYQMALYDSPALNGSDTDINSPRNIVTTPAITVHSVSPAHSFNDSSDKENSLLNEACISKGRDSNTVDSPGEIVESKSSPGFLSLCKSIAGKVVEFVKTSPSYLTAMPLTDLNSQSNACASPMLGQQKAVVDMLDDGNVSLGEKNPDVGDEDANHCEIDAELEEVEFETNDSKVLDQDIKPVSLDTVDSCVTGVSERSDSDDKSENLSETAVDNDVSPQANAQDWTSFHKTFDAMMNVLQQSSRKKKVSKSDDVKEDACPAVDTSDKVMDVNEPDEVIEDIKEEDTKSMCTESTFDNLNNIPVSGELGIHNVEIKHVSMDLSDQQASVSVQIDDVELDSDLRFTAVPKVNETTKVQKSKRRAFGIGDETVVDEKALFEDKVVVETKGKSLENIADKREGGEHYITSVPEACESRMSAMETEFRGHIGANEPQSVIMDASKTKTRKRCSMDLKQGLIEVECDSGQSGSNQPFYEQQNIISNLNTDSVSLETNKSKARRRRSGQITELPCVANSQLSKNSEQEDSSKLTSTIDLKTKDKFANKTSSRKRRSLKLDKAPSGITTVVDSDKIAAQTVESVKKKRGRPPKSVNVVNSSLEISNNVTKKVPNSVSGKNKRKSTSLIKAAVLLGQKGTDDLDEEQEGGCVSEITDVISQVKLSEDGGAGAVLGEESGSGRYGKLKSTSGETSVDTEKKEKKIPKRKRKSDLGCEGKTTSAGSDCMGRQDNKCSYVNQLTNEISQLKCKDVTLPDDVDAEIDADQKQRRQRRRSAGAAALKIRLEMEKQSPDAPSPRTSKQTKKRKIDTSTSLEELEKLYCNKNYVKPEEKRPWHTIYESPRNNEVFGKKRQLRIVDENPSQGRLRRRMQKATKNGWDPKRRRKQELGDDFVMNKLDAMYAELDSESEGESLESKLKSIVETT